MPFLALRKLLLRHLKVHHYHSLVTNAYNFHSSAYAHNAIVILYRNSR